MDADGPGLQGHPVTLVDDADIDPAGQQLRGEHQPGRAGADDQHLAVRGRSTVHAAYSARAAAPGHLKNYVPATYFFSGMPIPQTPRLPPPGPSPRPRPPAGSGYGSPAW